MREILLRCENFDQQHNHENRSTDRLKGFYYFYFSLRVSYQSCMITREKKPTKVLLFVQLIRASFSPQLFQAEIISKATSSVKSPIKNLADVNKNVNVQQLLTAIGYEFLRTPAEKLCDGGRELVMQQRGFQLINPTEKWFPGLSEIRENFASWDWRFGKTPKFAVQKNIQLKSGDDCHNLKLNVDVEKVSLHGSIFIALLITVFAVLLGID